MSFRLFIYYCAMCGGCAAFLGWVLGRQLADDTDNLVRAGLQGMFLGVLIAFGLGLVDAVGNLSINQMGKAFVRVLVAVFVGCGGGLIGGVVGQILYGRFALSLFLVLGWAITGTLIGASVGVHDVLARFIREENMAGAWKKVINGMLGGLLGGTLGGILFQFLKSTWISVFSDKPVDQLWSPSAIGFVILGMCIGLLIGLAQVILKEAWIRVEAGFRAGRELIISKNQITIGRAETCDIGLFGDAGTERLHARILQQDSRYFIADAGTPGGTYLNGQRIAGPAMLRSGDMVQVGNSILRFGERQKSAENNRPSAPLHHRRR